MAHKKKEKFTIIAKYQDGWCRELIAPSAQATRLNVTLSTLRSRRCRGQVDLDNYVSLEPGYYQFADTFEENPL